MSGPFSFEVQQAYAAEPPQTNAGEMVVESAAPEAVGQKVVIDGYGVFGFGLLWMLAIIGVVELLKRGFIALQSMRLKREYEPGPVYSNVLPLIPVFVGIGLAPVFGVQAFQAFSLHLTPLQAMFAGPIAGAGAGWAFVLLKPVLRAALPSVFARGVSVVTGVDVDASGEIEARDE